MHMHMCVCVPRLHRPQVQIRLAVSSEPARTHTPGWGEGGAMAAYPLPVAAHNK